LFDHVCGVLVDAGLRVVALSAGPLETSVEVWPDSGRGLNAAVRDGVGRTGLPVLVAHADLPSLTVPDVFSLVDTPGDVVIARSEDGGTNGLLMRSFVEPSFGPGSAHAHASRARRAGLVTKVVDIPGFARDIDDPRALTSYGASFRQPRP